MGDRGKLILVSDICCFDYWVSHCTHFICRTFPSVKARSGHMRMHKRRWFFWFQDVSLRLWYPGALSHWISIRTATGRTKLNDICSGSYGSAIVFLRNTCEKSDCPLQAIRLVFVMWKERAGTKVAILARLKTAVPFHPKRKGQQPKPSVCICICCSPLWNSFLLLNRQVLRPVLILFFFCFPIGACGILWFRRRRRLVAAEIDHSFSV